VVDGCATYIQRNVGVSCVVCVYILQLLFVHGLDVKGVSGCLGRCVLSVAVILR
jgi:hypothetical protein